MKNEPKNIPCQICGHIMVPILFIIILTIIGLSYLISGYDECKEKTKAKCNIKENTGIIIGIKPHLKNLFKYIISSYNILTINSNSLLSTIFIDKGLHDP